MYNNALVFNFPHSKVSYFMAKRKQNVHDKNKSTLFSGSSLTLKEISPLTAAQEQFFENYHSGKSQVLLGSPGTGKTFLSLYKAFQEISNLRSGYRRIVVVRSAVPTRNMGFMPGSREEKSEVYELPYKQICNDLFGRGDAYEILKKHRDIEFTTTSYIRGITLSNTIVIVDEFQNLTMHEASSIITRIGAGSKIIFCGDTLQTDFTQNKDKDIGLFLKTLENIPNDVAFTHFGVKDIVRSGLVKKFILSQIELGIV